MPLPKDLPGFYFDPEKNRYFPIKGPLPGSKRALPSSSTSSPSRKPSDSGRGYHMYSARRKKLIEPSKLIQSREIHGGLLTTKNGLYSFQQEYQKLQASHPEVWKYQNTTYISDSALEEMSGVVQTSQGLKEMHLLAMGGINCSIRLFGVRNVGGRCDYGLNYRPELIWPPMRPVHDCAPGIFSNSAASTSLSSSISCIRRIGRNIPNSTDNISCFRALVTTLGSGISGGSVYVLNLSEPLTFSENSRGLHRSITKISSCECTIWTADASCNGTKAAIGTNLGVSLINLETGRSSLVYRSRSDVLSQQFDLSGNILLCGIRNGAILAIDFRQRQSKCFEVSARPSASKIQCPPKKKPGRNLDSSNAVFMPSAVCSVVALQSDEQYFFGSSMDGSINLFDRRLLARAVQSYEGHVNSHSHLKLGVNPSETLLLSGGEDCFLRIWSIKTSELIFEENVSDCIFSTVCWPYYGDFSYGYDQFFKHDGENLYQSTCSWGVWLGSREGLFYICGA